MTHSLFLTAATGTQDAVCIKVALMCHLLAQLHQIIDLLIPLAHVSLQHLQNMPYQHQSFKSQSHAEATTDLQHQEDVRIWGSHTVVAEDSVLLGCYIMSGGLVPCIERNCRACTQTTTLHHIPEERDLLQRKCMAFHTIPLRTHKKVMVKKSYHDLQRQTLRYKWMIMICRHRPSITNGLSWSAETDPQVQWMIMICRDRTSGKNWWSWSA